MKLKTLKNLPKVRIQMMEINEKTIKHAEWFLTQDCVAIPDLRQEAIKRWQYLKKKYMGEKEEKMKIHYWGRMEEIKEFNNLTDEDLK